MNAVELLLDSSLGVYVPHAFAKNYDLSQWSNIDQQDIDILLKGPWDNDLYWDAWDSILNEATYTNNQDQTWHLYQDGDLFALCDVLMTNEEYRAFYGEDMFHE